MAKIVTVKPNNYNNAEYNTKFFRNIIQQSKRQLKLLPLCFDYYFFRKSHMLYHNMYPTPYNHRF